jgi:hypothetical protein
MVDKFELNDHELLVLREACRTVDLLDTLQAAIDEDGPLQRWGEGSKAHPAAVEVRQHRVTLARLLGVLAIPVDDEDRQARRVVFVGRTGWVGNREAASA